MEWWSNLSERMRDNLTDEYFYMRVAKTLTGSEIEKIWRKEQNNKL